MELYKPSPITEIREKSFRTRKVRLFIKREDLLHPVVSGNKWRKLKYNLQLAEEGGYSKILTFGGAFSNHIVAVAYAARKKGLGSIGVIRGEKSTSENPTMQEASSYGMKLHFITREEFAKRDSVGFIETLNNEYGNFYLIPEGGANAAGVKGVEELAKELSNFSHIIMPVGTGATLAGIINGKLNEQYAMGFAVLKGEEYLEESTGRFVQPEKDLNWSIIHDFHFGGYAKFSTELIDFINRFRKTYDIQLDPIYTGKMMFGVFSLLDKGYFEGGSELVAIHTGGIQGIRGFNQRFGNLIESN